MLTPVQSSSIEPKHLNTKEIPCEVLTRMIIIKQEGKFPNNIFLKDNYVIR